MCGSGAGGGGEFVPVQVQWFTGVQHGGRLADPLGRVPMIWVPGSGSAVGAHTAAVHTHR
ncbi:hypothetical protein [Nocardia brevicatena]|uniref:hypothetical protein n=1 Tax=Nocardia brevicatena TaxID=37327 RepID=UPI0012FB64A1|nr:hypothetical protein [Nocardia brevicatena]